MVRETVYKMQEESFKKQPEISVEAYSYLQYLAKRGNAMCTKSMVVYEILQTMGVIESDVDFIDEMESNIDQSLCDIINDSFPEKTVITLEEDQAEYDQHLDMLNQEEIDPTQGTVKITSLLPRIVEDDIQDYGFNRTLEEAIIEYSKYPFSDRVDRYNFKKDVYEFVENNKEPNHRVAKTLVNFESEKDYFSLSLAEDIEKSSEQWYKSPDLDFETAKKMQTREDRGLSKTDDGIKKEIAMQNIIDNEPFSYKDAVEAYMELFDVKRQSARRNIRKLKNDPNVEFMDVRREIRIIDDMSIDKINYYTDATDKEKAKIIEKIANTNDKISTSKLGARMAQAGWINAPTEPTEYSQGMRSSGQSTAIITEYVSELKDKYGINNLEVDKGLNIA